MRWKLRLLGAVELRGPNGRAPLEGRIAAALTYVACCAPTPKHQLSALLWPDTPQPQVRNNLRQLLRRFRLVCGGARLLRSVGRQDALVLSEDVDCDLLRLRDAALAGRSDRILELQGALLAGLDFDEVPEFSRWLDGARVAADGWYRKLLALELRRREEARDFLGAISVAEAWLSAEPESEQIGQVLMRLHHATGNRRAALEVYEQLKARLEHELGVTPQRDTASLARAIAESLQRERHGSAEGVHCSVPLTLLRPPTLLGREREWQQLQEGWERAQLLCIRGAPGVGKTRLALDFASAKGTPLLMAGHPADSRTPYSTVVRALRQRLAGNAATRLPAWLRSELGALLPELAPARRRPPVSEDPPAVRRFHALEVAFAQLSHEASAVVLDDLHCWDAESLNFLGYWWSTLGANPQPRFLCCVGFPPLHPGASVSAQWPPLVDAWQVELAPLSQASVLALVDSLELPGADPGVGEQMWQLAGGNPALLLEAAREWSRTPTSGAAAEGETMGAPEASTGVRSLLRRYLERLHPEALAVVQVAAITREGFDLALAAEVLGLPALVVADLLHRLERMGLAWSSGPAPFHLCAALHEPGETLRERLILQRCTEALARREVQRRTAEPPPLQFRSGGL